MQPKLQLPLTRNDNDFGRYIKGLLDGYVQTIRAIDPGDEITRRILAEALKIERFCEKLSLAVESSLKSDQPAAASYFGEAVALIRPELEPLTTGATHQFIRHLYRIRTDLGAHEDPRRGLFHIPFDQQHKCKTQRYSIPGHPSLYVGGSVYICWEEMGMGTPGAMHVSRFEPASGTELKVLDFMARPSHTALGLIQKYTEGKDVNSDEQQLRLHVALAVVWPLMAAVSIRRTHRNAAFVAEYMVPQLLLQWLSKQSAGGIDGIAYSSVSSRSYADYPALIANVVFPTREFAPSGYCTRLAGKLTMTEPIAWDFRSGRLDLTRPCHAGALVDFFFYPGTRLPYSGSCFCEIESELCSMPALPLPTTT
jgi:hypothetical protein